MVNRLPALVLALVVLAAGSGGCGGDHPGTGAIEADIREVRLQLFEAARSYFSNETPPPETVNRLTAVLSRIGDIPHSHQPRAGLPSGAADRFDALRAAISAFTAPGPGTLPFDTVRRAFRDVLYAFHNCYGGYFRHSLPRDGRDKLLLLSASVTCDCTRERSDAYTRDIILAEEYLAGFPHILLLDCSVETGLMESYGVGLLPAVILLDSRDSVLVRFQGIDGILPPLVEFIASRRDLEIPDP
jgi:hypothetical protein